MTDAELLYQTKVTDLLNAYLAGKSSFMHLAAVIGCRVNNFGGDPIELPLQPAWEHDAFLRSVLLDYLRCHATKKADWSDNGYALLDGLVRHARWRECLNTMDDAYAFAGLLLEFSFAADMTVAPRGAAFRQAVTPDVCFALKDWLPTVTCLQTDLFPTTEVLARALFGDLWCDMMLPDVGLEYHNCASKITAYRPEFRPGLLPVGAESANEILPGLEMP
jgi:hypothetical protein